MALLTIRKSLLCTNDNGCAGSVRVSVAETIGGVFGSLCGNVGVGDVFLVPSMGGRVCFGVSNRRARRVLAGRPRTAALNVGYEEAARAMDDASGPHILVIDDEPA